MSATPVLIDPSINGPCRHYSAICVVRLSPFSEERLHAYNEITKFAEQQGQLCGTALDQRAASAAIGLAAQTREKSGPTCDLEWKWTQTASSRSARQSLRGVYGDESFSHRYNPTRWRRKCTRAARSKMAEQMDERIRRICGHRKVVFSAIASQKKTFHWYSNWKNEEFTCVHRS